MFDIIKGAADAIRAKTDFKPDVGIVLGSGLGDYAKNVENAIVIPYSEIPGFPLPTVDGHAGQLIMGTLNGAKVALMNGRFHFYEGYTQAQSAIGARALARLGIKTLILTNAAGGVDISYNPGDLMLISDHINFSGTNPLIGKNIDEFGPRFPDMSNLYDRELRAKVKQAAAEAGIALREGVYAMMSGPSYETPAEIRMLRILGANAVGMSTVPEAISAAHAGVKVIGISCITNMAAGVLEAPLNHQEVMETGARAAGTFAKLLGEILTVL